MSEMTCQNHTSNSQPVSLCFEFVNNSCPKFYTYPLVVRVSLYIFFGTVSVLTVLGNVLVITTVLHFKQLHTPTNYLILSLAVADMLVGALIMPFFMLQTVESCWYTGHLHCKMYVGLGAMLVNTSVLHLCFISVDRYFAVCHPLSYQTTITPSVTGIMIFYSWSIAGVIAFCVSFLTINDLDSLTLENQMCEGSCFMLHDRLSAVLSPILEFYVPGIIMICMYTKIFFVAKKQARVIQEKRKVAIKSNVNMKTERKATKTLAIVIGVFLVSWLPFSFCNLVAPFIYYSTPPLLLEALAWIACLNSMCNPIVYALFYSWFRKAFKIILLGKAFNINSSGMNLVSN